MGINQKMHVFVTENGVTSLKNIEKLPEISNNEYMTMNGRLITSFAFLQPFYNLIVHKKILGGSLGENEKALATKRFDIQVCRKCNSKAPIRATHCRKRQCGFSNKLRLKK